MEVRFLTAVTRGSYFLHLLWPLLTASRERKIKRLAPSSQGLFANEGRDPGNEAGATYCINKWPNGPFL